MRMFIGVLVCFVFALSIVAGAEYVCTSYPCEYDGRAIFNAHGTVDSSPEYVSAEYPYKFSLTEESEVNMILDYDVWSASPYYKIPNTVFVKVDGVHIFNYSKIKFSTIGFMSSVISLGVLSAGDHLMEIYASPYENHFHFDKFRLETSEVLGVDVCVDSDGGG